MAKRSPLHPTRQEAGACRFYSCVDTLLAWSELSNTVSEFMLDFTRRPARCLRLFETDAITGELACGGICGGLSCVQRCVNVMITQRHAHSRNIKCWAQVSGASSGDEQGLQVARLSLGGYYIRCSLEHLSRRTFPNY